MKSKFLRLNLKDLIKGFIVAVFSALLTAVYQALQAGNIEGTWAFWKPILFSAIGAGLAYLIKNFFTNSEDSFASNEKK